MRGRTSRHDGGLRLTPRSPQFAPPESADTDIEEIESDDIDHAVHVPPKIGSKLAGCLRWSGEGGESRLMTVHELAKETKIPPAEVLTAVRNAVRHQDQRPYFFSQEIVPRAEWNFQTVVGCIVRMRDSKVAEGGRGRSKEPIKSRTEVEADQGAGGRPKSRTEVEADQGGPRSRPIKEPAAAAIKNEELRHRGHFQNGLVAKAKGCRVKPQKVKTQRPIEVAEVEGPRRLKIVLRNLTPMPIVCTPISRPSTKAEHVPPRMRGSVAAVSFVQKTFDIQGGARGGGGEEEEDEEEHKAPADSAVPEEHPHYEEHEEEEDQVVHKAPADSAVPDCRFSTSSGKSAEEQCHVEVKEQELSHPVVPALVASSSASAAPRRGRLIKMLLASLPSSSAPEGPLASAPAWAASSAPEGPLGAAPSSVPEGPLGAAPSSLPSSSAPEGPLASAPAWAASSARIDPTWPQWRIDATLALRKERLHKFPRGD